MSHHWTPSTLSRSSHAHSLRDYRSVQHSHQNGRARLRLERRDWRLHRSRWSRSATRDRPRVREAEETEWDCRWTECVDWTGCCWSSDSCKDKGGRGRRYATARQSPSIACSLPLPLRLARSTIIPTQVSTTEVEVERKGQGEGATERNSTSKSERYARRRGFSWPIDERTCEWKWEWRGGIWEWRDQVDVPKCIVPHDTLQ